MGTGRTLHNYLQTYMCNELYDELNFQKYNQNFPCENGLRCATQTNDTSVDICHSPGCVTDKVTVRTPCANVSPTS